MTCWEAFWVGPLILVLPIIGLIAYALTCRKDCRDYQRQLTANNNEVLRLKDEVKELRQEKLQTAEEVLRLWKKL